MLVLNLVRARLFRLRNIHSRQGIKVQLESGQVGRVKKIVVVSRAEKKCTSRAERNCTTEHRGVSIKVSRSMRAYEVIPLMRTRYTAIYVECIC